ncbi:lipoprotein [Terrihabitans soli]|uniref:Lipoprotein n=1 Tax=Terrihabitans soli TaxID=708113 RepID=A0A6S6QTV3_9HYPH|nr:DUF4394 domain-containing protein [Terrihabitans soli]BCJ90501.1 lipoprotein [Terrihabitans soli]
MTTRPAFACALLAAISLNAAAASADTLIGLSGTDSLVLFDAAGKATKTVSLDKPIWGLDVRPSDGALYGVTADGAVVTIDTATGKTTEKSKLSEGLKAGSTATIDFNPVADRLRVMADDGTNLRINVDDGKATADKPHAFKEGDASASKTPKVVAGAYTNSKNGPKPEKTALYNIDASGALVKQDPPNDGVLNTIGSIGMTPTGPVAFNIVSDGIKNSAWLAHGGTLYSVDLETGAAKEAMKLEGGEKLTDLAWWE